MFNFWPYFFQFPQKNVLTMCLLLTCCVLAACVHACCLLAACVLACCLLAVCLMCAGCVHDACFIHALCMLDMYLLVFNFCLICQMHFEFLSKIQLYQRVTFICLWIISQLLFTPKYGELLPTNQPTDQPTNWVNEAPFGRSLISYKTSQYTLVL